MEKSLGYTITAENTYDYTLTVFVFIILQSVDFTTTYIGLHIGLSEASPFINTLMHMSNPMTGLLLSKLIAIILGGYCVLQKRFSFLVKISWWYLIIDAWNLRELYVMLKYHPFH